MHQSDSRIVFLLLMFIVIALFSSCFAVLFGLATYQALVHHATTPVGVIIVVLLLFLILISLTIITWRFVYRAFLAASSDTSADRR